MYKFELDACGDLDALPQQIADTADQVWLRLVTLKGDNGYPVVEIASESRTHILEVLMDVWGVEEDEAVDMLKRQEQAGVTGVVMYDATIHVAVRDGVVESLAILPHGVASLFEGDERAPAAADGQTWSCLKDLPSSIRWEA